MTKSNKSPNPAPNPLLDQQYLKAMKIDLWVSRDTPGAIAESAQAAAPVEQTASDDAAAAVAFKDETGNQLSAISGWTAAELARQFSSLPVLMPEVQSNPQVLVVTEAPQPDAESMALLSKMLGAIELSDGQWVQANLDADSNTTMAAVLETTKAQAVVLMVNTDSRLEVIDGVRSQQIKPAGCDAFCIVTYHPQVLIDHPQGKRPAWEDLKLLRQWLN